MEKVEEFLDENGFACDKATCFRDAPGLRSGLPDELDRT